MNKRIRIGILCVALAAAAVGISAAGEEQGLSRGKGMPTKAVTFTTIGMFSGTLSDEIVVNGQSIYITNKTSIHRVGEGPVDVGEGVSKSSVMVSGVMKGKKAMATLILVSEPESSADFSQDTVAGNDAEASAPVHR